MKPVVTIALADVYMFLKDKTGYLWLFVVPLVFTYFFGMALQGDEGREANPRPSVLIDNKDQGYLGGMLMQEMDAQGMQLVDPADEQTPSRGVRIPADFTQRVENAEPVEITFFRLEESGLEPAAMVELRLARAIIGLTSGLFAIVTDSQAELSETSMQEQLQLPDRVLLDAKYAGPRPVPSGFEQSVPGYMVMFTLMNLLMFGGSSVALERTAGTLRRIAVHPIARWQVVLGKISGRFLLGAVQITFFLVVGGLLFGVNYGGSLGLIVLTLAIFAWLCAALGVLVGSVLSRVEQVQGVCLLLSIAMAALGGCWWPLEIVPDYMRTVAYALPTGWAMDALHQLISFGGGFAQISWPLGVLTAFACVTTGLAAKTLRYV